MEIIEVMTKYKPATTPNTVSIRNRECRKPVRLIFFIKIHVNTRVRLIPKKSFK